MKNGNNGNKVAHGVGGVGIVLPNVTTHILRSYSSDGRTKLPRTKMGLAFRVALRRNGVRV